MRAPLLFILACLLFFFCTPLSARDRLDNPSYMHLAAEQLVRTQLPSGLFTYAFDVDTGNIRASTGKDGVVLVRQSFAAFALAQYASRFPRQPALDAVKRFLENAADRSLPVGKGTLQLILEKAGTYNQPRLWKYVRGALNRFGLLYSKHGSGLLLSADKSYELAYPGATALALAAGLQYQSVSGDHQFDDLLGAGLRG